MSPLNEIPIIEGLNASGHATVWIHTVRNSSNTVTSGSVEFNVRYSFPGAVTLTGLHIHRGTSGENGPVVVDSGIRGAEPVTDSAGNAGIVRQTVFSSAEAIATINSILAGSEGFYLNLHSTDFPGGVLRGQLLRSTVTTFMTALSPANEVPAVTGLAASGSATVTLIAGRDRFGRTSAEATFDVQYTGFPADTAFTGLHIHNAPAGTNGGVTIDSGLRGSVPVASSGAGSLRYTVDVNTANANALSTVTGAPATPANFYVNLHTARNPGGAIRGQLQEPSRAIISVVATPAQEVPAIEGLAASAPAQLIVYGLRNDAGALTAGSVTFNVSYLFPGEITITGLHIHEAAAGQNGPVRIDSGIRGDSPVIDTDGVGSLDRRAAVTSTDGLAALNGLLLNPANYYLNLHTSANPGGAVRAQLGSLSTALPVLTDAGGFVGGNRTASASFDGRFIIRGSNLAFADGSAVGVVGTGQPTQINGTSVTIAGIPAFVTSVTADTIIGRVPPNIQIGPVPVGVVPVYVTNRNGRSNVVSLTLTRGAATAN